MSLRAVIEIALHFENFRNIDLMHQGLYRLKARIFRDGSDRHLLATPCGHISNPPLLEPSRPKPARTDDHHLIPAHTLDDQCTFSTRSFLVRYCDEEVELNDIGQFRVEVPLGEVEESSPFSLVVDLMFADVAEHGGVESFGQKPDVDAIEFISVSTRLFHMHGAHLGLHDFAPVVFDEYHFCMANLVVHSVLVDFRLRLQTSLLSSSSWSRHLHQSQGAAGADLEQEPGYQPLIDSFSLSENVANLLEVDDTAPDSSSPKDPSTVAVEPGAARQNGGLSLAEWLFAGRPMENAEPLPQMFEALYRKYVGRLAIAYAKQATWLRDVCAKCLTPALVEALGDAVAIPPLELPHNVPVSALLGTEDARDTTDGHASLRSVLKERLGTVVTEQAVAAHLAYDLNAASCQVLDVWHKLLNIVSCSSREVTTLLRGTWEERIVKQWGVSIVRETCDEGLATARTEVVSERHNQESESLRREARARPPDPACVEDVAMMPGADVCPILFEERQAPRKDRSTCTPGAPPEHFGGGDGRKSFAPAPYRGAHLFVLVHGFQGCSFDMRTMRNNMAVLYPGAIFLCSRCNEDNTEGDLGEMGTRLAQEVVNYIRDWCPGSALGRLSFIAHSIGGLIVRAALPLLRDYSSRMCTMLTLSTAHVGYFLRSPSLFHMGLRVLQTWSQSQCLSELSMTDCTDPKESFLYKLSEAPGFEFFRHVVLVSCPSDQYGPFDSARVEIGTMVHMHSNAEAYEEMVRNIWRPVKPENVYRLDVNFHVAETSFDAFIGRAAHIKFLECQPIMRMIIHNYSFLFQ